MNNPIIGHKIYGQGNIKVIALHSWMDDAESWNTTIPFLNGEQYTYVFMDVRGYGLSKHVTGAYDLKEIMNDIYHLADELEISKFHLIGHSMCGMVAQYTALKDINNRIDKVALITPVAASGFPADDETKGFLKSIIHNIDIAKMGYGAFTSNRYSDHWYTMRAQRHVAVTDADAQAAYMNMWLNEDFRSEMSVVDKPILVIAGDHDHPMFRLEVQKANFNEYRNVRFVTFPGAGHFPMQESPVLLASTIESFLE